MVKNNLIIQTTKMKHFLLAFTATLTLSPHYPLVPSLPRIVFKIRFKVKEQTPLYILYVVGSATDKLPSKGFI